MRSSISLLALAVALFTSSAANAQSAVPSVLSGKTLGSGMLLHAQMGWPSVSATLLGSADRKLDLGGKFSFLYGYEGIGAYAGIPGTKVQGVMRLNLLERGKFNLGLRFSPGMFFYFLPSTVIGMTLPVDVAAGIALRPNLMLSFGVDLPMFVAFGPYAGFTIPLLVGGGIEYAINSSLALTANLRAGPSAPVGTGAYWGRWDDGVRWCVDARGNPYRCGSGGFYGWAAFEAQFGLSVKL